MNISDSNVKRMLAPTGRLRAAINRGNAVLVQIEPTSGAPTGVTIDLARELANRLGVPVDLLTYDAAGQVFDALKRQEWDVAFLAIEPVRSAEIDFTPPYVIIEGRYVVPEKSKITTPADVDLASVRIAVVRGSAYDLYLSRSLESATLVRHTSGEDAMNGFVNNGFEAVAGVKQALIGLMKGRTGLRMIEQPFMEIRQALGTPKGRRAGIAYLKSFIEEMKASGFVATSLKRGNQYDAIIAPPHVD